MKLGNIIKYLVTFILCLFLIGYLATPPYNKIAQWQYIYNNLDFLKIKEKMIMEGNEYLFYRNNAVYLAKMNEKQDSLKEIDKAIEIAQNKSNEPQLQRLYSERSKIRMYFDDYEGALDDLLKIEHLTQDEHLKLAMLLKKQGDYKQAANYCNQIINKDIKAYIGYACLAEVYAEIKKYNSSVMVYSLLIDRVPGKAKYYADRAMYKKAAGDIEGYEADLKKAKDIYPMVDTKTSITNDAIYKKHLDLK